MNSIIEIGDKYNEVIARVTFHVNLDNIIDNVLDLFFDLEGGDEVLASDQLDVVINALDKVAPGSYGHVDLSAFTTNGRYFGNIQNILNSRIYNYRFKEDGEIDFYFPSILNFELKGNSSLNYNTFIPNAPLISSDIAYNWLTISNLTDLNQEFTVKFYEPEGSLYESKDGVFIEDARESSLSIPARSSVVVPGGHQFGRRGVGQVLIEPSSSDGRYFARLARYAPDGENYYFASSVNAQKPINVPVYVPVSKGGNAYNYVEIANPTGSTADIEIAVYQKGEKSIAQKLRLYPYRVGNIYASELLTEAVSGYIKITPLNLGTSYVVNGNVYYFNEQELKEGVFKTSSSYVNSPIYSLPDFYEATGSYNSFLNMTNWVRISNLEDIEKTVDMGVFSSLGVEVKEFTLAPYETRNIGIIPNIKSSDLYFGVPKDEYGTVFIEGDSFFAEMVRISYDEKLTIIGSSSVPFRTDFSTNN